MRINLIIFSTVFTLIIPIFVFASGLCPQLSRNLVRGMRGDDVHQLQAFLIDQNFLSTDLTTGFFGSKTESAVQQFQCAKEITCTGDAASTGWGIVGPKTRSAIEQTCGAPKRDLNINNFTPQAQSSGAAAIMCALSVRPSVVQRGQSSMLAWSSINARHVSIDILGATSLAGSMAVTPYRTTTYTGTFIGDGTTTCETTLTVIPVAANACMFNNIVMTEGQSAIAYQSANVSAGSVCVSEQRTCFSAMLSGSYAYASCIAASTP